MITADSSVWIDYLAGRPTPAATALDAVLDDASRDVVLLDVVLMEVLRGFRHEREWQLAQEALLGLPLSVAGGRTVALRATDLYRSLRQGGVTVRSPIDLLVGAWCIENNCTLIHNDRDFAPMQSRGLHVWGDLPYA